MHTLLLIAFIALSRVMASDIQPDDRLAIRTLSEWTRVCGVDGENLWHKSLCGPIVLVNPSTRAAIANFPDPDGKFQKEGDVFLGVFPEQFTPSNTAVQWGAQQWATVMLPLPSDRFRSLSLLAHESFHRIQEDLGLSSSDAANVHLDTKAGRLWLRLELRALARALRSQGQVSREAAVDAMLFRKYRHTLFPGSEATEAALEKQEGLAEYTGVFAAMRETGEDVTRPARSVEAFEDSDAYARSFAYATGPALGLLLDRFAAGWRGRAAVASLDSMLISALRVEAPRNLESSAQRRAALYGYAAVASAEHDREELHKALLVELKGKFIDGAVLQFPSAPEMRRVFNPGALVPFPPHGTYYPSGTFTANWGKLQVESGGALVAPDNRSLRVTAPSDPDARPIRGAGWALQIAPGWTIRPSGSGGGFAVVPSEKK
jgi:hypothetical protein